jgi:hypothetical protein
MAQETEEEYDTLFVGAYAIPFTLIGRPGFGSLLMGCILSCPTGVR